MGGGQGWFALEPLSGGGGGGATTDRQYKLVTSMQLDRELRDEYRLTVECRDAGVPAALNRSRDLRVRVADVNDHTPRFHSRSDMQRSLCRFRYISYEIVSNQ